METRVPPSERLRRELDDKLTGIESSEDPIEEVARLGAGLIGQQAMEDEVTQFLGRGRYERSGEPTAYRNGYEPTTVKASSGPIELQRPAAARGGGPLVRVADRRQGRRPHPRPSLIWAVLELSSRGWRGVVMTPKTVAEIERLHRAADGSAQPPATDETEEVVAA